MNGSGNGRTQHSGKHSQRQAVIYTRVSSDRAEGRSVAEQEADCRAVCERNGWPIRRVISDNDYSATRYKRTERPGYIELQQVLRSGDVLVTWESSRGYRDLDDYLTIRNLCAARGVLLSYSGRTYDLSEGDDRFSTGLDALIAERYAEETRKRILRTTQANVEAGKPHGKIPYGYKAIRDPETGRIVKRVPNPDEANVIREIVKRLIDGESQRSICQDLNRRGIPTKHGKTWNVTVLKQLVLRPSNAGMRSHHGEIIRAGTWEPIIPLEDYHRVSAILKDPARAALYYRGTEPKHLLSGIAVCGECGKPLWHSKAKGPQRRDGVRPVYEGYRCARGCVKRSTADLDAMIERIMLLLLADPRVVQRLQTTGVDEAHEAAQQAEALRNHLDEQINAIVDQDLPAAITAKALARLNERLVPQIEKAEARSAEPAANAVLQRLYGPDAEKRWNALTIAEKREAVRSALVIQVCRADRRTRVFDPASIIVSWKIG